MLCWVQIDRQTLQYAICVGYRYTVKLYSMLCWIQIQRQYALKYNYTICCIGYIQSTNVLYIIEYAELGTDRAPECFKVYTVCRIAHRQSASVLKYIIFCT